MRAPARASGTSGMPRSSGGAGRRGTGRPPRWSFGEEGVGGRLEENALEPEFVGVDSVTVTFEALREVELYLRDRVVRKWVEDGRWEHLADAFARGERRLTEAYLVVKARRLAHPAPAEGGTSSSWGPGSPRPAGGRRGGPGRARGG